MFNFNTNPNLPDGIKKKIDDVGTKKKVGPSTASHINKLLDEFNILLNKHCGIYVYNDKYYTTKQYHTSITLGNEDSLKKLVQSVTIQYKAMAGVTPHIITANYFDGIEHLEQLEKAKMIELTRAPLNVVGKLSPVVLKKIIKKNTCLVIVNYLDPIFGTTCDVKELSDACHEYKVPLHVNFNCKFGHDMIAPADHGVDSFMFDFSNLGGVRGFGVLGISHNLYDGYKLQKLLNTKNKDIVDPILLSMVNQEIALLYANKKKRSTDIRRTHGELLKELRKKYNVVEFKDYIQKKYSADSRKLLVICSGAPSNVLTLIPEAPVNIRGDIYKISILNSYSANFNSLLKKNNLEANPFTRAIVLSWGGYIPSKAFVKSLENLY